MGYRPHPSAIRICEAGWLGWKAVIPDICIDIYAASTPSAANRIHRKDLPKLTRAVEIMTRAGRPTSEIQREPRTPLIGFSVLKIGLAPDRAELRRRIDARTLRMFEGGLIDQTRTIIEAVVRQTPRRSSR